MNTASPSKRRALAPLDANTRSPLAASRLSPSKLNVWKTKLNLGKGKGTKHIESETIKRPVELEASCDAPPAAKRRRLSGAGSGQPSPQNKKPTSKESEDVSSRAPSPENSSLFDNSTMDNSNVTAITEPEVEPIEPVATETRPRQRSMTREEARQKAEILRLRLGLASYKVRTNQADVPLERLQIRPLPRGPLRTSLSAVSLPPPTARLARPLQQKPSPRPDRKCDKTSSGTERTEGGAHGQETMELSSSFSSLARTERNRSVTGEQQQEKESEREAEAEAEPTLPASSLNTPERQKQERPVVEEVEDGGRDGAAEGLLSLSQSSPVS